jgi:hypothetical protein
VIRIRFSSPAVQRLAERALAGTLSRRGQRRLSEALAAPDAEADREAYDQLARLFAAVEGTDSLVAAQHERILDQVTRGLAAAPDGAPRAGAERPRRLALRWLAPALGVLLVAVGVALLIPRRADQDRDFQPRGSKLTPARGGLVGLRAHCIRDGRIVPPVDGETVCRISDELQLSVTHTAGYTNLLVVGLHEDGGELWYYPVPPTGRSGPAPRDVEDEPLGQAIRLDVNHRPGTVRLAAVFSRAPLEATRALTWLGADGQADALAQPDADGAEGRGEAPPRSRPSQAEGLAQPDADGAEGRGEAPPRSRPSQAEGLAQQVTVVKLRVTIKGGAP